MSQLRLHVDPVELAIFQSSIHSIAEEMGAALRRTSISPNIKERRDYSCAVFDAKCRVIAMGDHMPVHLGSMPMSVQAAVARLSPDDAATIGELTDLAPSRSLTVVADPAVEPGGALVEIGSTTIDSQLSPALERVRAVIAGSPERDAS